MQILFLFFVCFIVLVDQYYTLNGSSSSLKFLTHRPSVRHWLADINAYRQADCSTRTRWPLTRPDWVVVSPVSSEGAQCRKFGPGKNQSSCSTCSRQLGVGLPLGFMGTKKDTDLTSSSPTRVCLRTNCDQYRSCKFSQEISFFLFFFFLLSVSVFVLMSYLLPLPSLWIDVWVWMCVCGLCVRACVSYLSTCPHRRRPEEYDLHGRKRPRADGPPDFNQRAGCFPTKCLIHDQVFHVFLSRMWHDGCGRRVSETTQTHLLSFLKTKISLPMVSVFILRRPVAES